MMVVIRNFLKKNKLIDYGVKCIKIWRNKGRLYEYIIGDCKNLKEYFTVQSFGREYIDKVIYLIDISEKRTGLFAMYRLSLYSLYLAERLHMEPYIVWSETPYSGKECNLFECYWMQPSNLEYEKVAKSHTIVKFNRNHLRWFEDEYFENNNVPAGYSVTEHEIEEMARIKNLYIRYTPDIKKHLELDTLRLLNGEKTMGIHFRGTDFKVGFGDHPVGLEIDDYYPYIDECIEKGYTQFFLATDDENALNAFKKKYEKYIMYYSDVFRSDSNVATHIMAKNKNGKRIGYETIRDMYTLSYCDGLIGGNSQVTIAARVERESRGENFSYLKIIDKGINKYDFNSIKRVTSYYKSIDKGR